MTLQVFLQMLDVIMWKRMWDEQLEYPLTRSGHAKRIEFCGKARLIKLEDKQLRVVMFKSSDNNVVCL